MARFLLLPLILSSLLLSGCVSWVPYNKADIQQGNQLQAGKISQLKVGMSRAQINDLLGNPVLSDVLNSEQMEYIYTNQPNKAKYVEKRLILQLRQGKLVRASGDYTTIPASLRK